MVEFDELAPVVDMNRALDDDAPRVHDDWPSNLVLESFIRHGDLDQARRQAAVSIMREYRLNRHASVPLEGRGVLAYFDKRLDELVVYTSTQFPHVVRTMLAECLGIAERRLRVVAPDVGGGFGV
jgi:carbon-monoxide dehydrogenase large subunit